MNDTLYRVISQQTDRGKQMSVPFPRKYSAIILAPSFSPASVSCDLVSMFSLSRFLFAAFAVYALVNAPVVCADSREVEFFERRVRPLLVKHCYECHSEESQTREGGLLLDRESGWLRGGDSGQAVVPNDAKASLLLKAISFEDPDLQMPPEEKLSDDDIAVIRRWIIEGADGPQEDMGATEFSQLGDQDVLFDKAASHWAFQPLSSSPSCLRLTEPTGIKTALISWSTRHCKNSSSHHHVLRDGRTLARRLYYDLTGLPPTIGQIRQFEIAAKADRAAAITELVDELLSSVEYAQHFAAMWLDVGSLCRHGQHLSSRHEDSVLFPIRILVS